jgi:hypothetical protein
MSFPGALTALPAVASINPIDVLMASINSNPYFIGLMMVLLNIGGRFLSLEISKDQEKFLSTPVIRRFLLFAILFVGTRNIVVAACLTIILILLIGYLFNENSELCVWHSCSRKQFVATQQPALTGLTAEELMIYRRLHDKSMAEKVKEESADKQSVPEEPSAYSYYLASIKQLS